MVSVGETASLAQRRSFCVKHRATGEETYDAQPPGGRSGWASVGYCVNTSCSAPGRFWMNNAQRNLRTHQMLVRRTCCSRVRHSTADRLPSRVGRCGRWVDGHSDDREHSDIHSFVVSRRRLLSASPVRFTSGVRRTRVSGGQCLSASPRVSGGRGRSDHFWETRPRMAMLARLKLTAARARVASRPLPSVSHSQPCVIRLRSPSST
jgi:hypothetical protein